MSQSTCAALSDFVKIHAFIRILITQTSTILVKEWKKPPRRRYMTQNTDGSLNYKQDCEAVTRAYYLQREKNVCAFASSSAPS